jgi:conjugative relaxase-like TrwC/TraI family protein
MISISDPIKDTKQCRYYLAMARSGYYANAHDEPGYWAGRGAELLGLKGPVTQEVLQNLFDGFSPDGRTKLVQNAGSPDRQRAIDMAVTPPKSFAVYWAMASPSERTILWRLHHEGVDAVRGYFQEKAGLTRRGKGGKLIEPASMVLACFDHETSRDNDPLPHTHIVVIHVVVREDGTTGTLYNHELYVHRAKADMIYNVHLALGLMLEFGLQVEEEGHGFRIVGVPKEVCDVFSKRRAEIMEYLDEHGLSGAEAASIAAVQTRSAKQHIPREELFAEWHRIGRSLGWGPEEAAKLSREKRVRELTAKYARLLTPGTEQASADKRTAMNERAAAEGPKEPSPEFKWARPKTSDEVERHERREFPSSKPGTGDVRSEGQSKSPAPGAEEPLGLLNEKGPWLSGKTTPWFRQTSRGRYVLKHPRWGDILWKADLGIVEIRIQKKRLFRKSPDWNPASEIAAPALRIIPWRIKLFDKTPPHKRQQPELLWKKAFLVGELRLQREKLFHDAPWWSPIKNLEYTRLKLGWRSSDIPESEKKKKSEITKQSRGMSQSL